MNRTLACGLAVAALATTLDARADGFVGIGGGASEWPDSSCPVFSECDHRSNAWMMRAGAMIRPWIGIEARYVDLGRASSVSRFIGGTPLDIGTRLESRGAGVGAVFAVPVADDFHLTGTAGVARIRTRGELSTPGFTAVAGSIPDFVTTASDTKTKPYYGVGVDYRLSPAFSVGVEATRYRVSFGGTDDIDTLLARLTYRFR